MGILIWSIYQVQIGWLHVLWCSPNLITQTSSRIMGTVCPIGVCTEDNNLGSTHCEPRVVMWAKLFSAQQGGAIRNCVDASDEKFGNETDRSFGVVIETYTYSVIHRSFGVVIETYTYSVISRNYRHCVSICWNGVVIDITMTTIKCLCSPLIISSITDIAMQISTDPSLSVPTIECSVSSLVTDYCTGFTEVGMRFITKNKPINGTFLGFCK